VEKSVFVGVLAEISMKAKILRQRLKKEPESVEKILAQIERLEDELLEAFGFFCGSKPK
jgi:hypothetical protein